MAAEGLYGVFLSVKMDSCGHVVVRLSTWTGQILRRREKEGRGEDMKKDDIRREKNENRWNVILIL